MKKIHIVGSVGSGKTTLARKLAGELNYPCFELDQVLWGRRCKNNDIRHTPEESEKLLNSLISAETWIVEGAHIDDWTFKSFEKSEVILFLDINYYARVYRIIKRYTKQKLGMENSNYKPTFKILIKMFKWNRMFEDNKQMNLNKLEIYNDKLIIIKNNKELEEAIISLKKVYTRRDYNEISMVR